MITIEAIYVDHIVSFEGSGPLLVEEIIVADGERCLGCQWRGGVIVAKLYKEVDTLAVIALIVSLGEEEGVFLYLAVGEGDMLRVEVLELVDDTGIIAGLTHGASTLYIACGIGLKAQGRGG